MIIKECRKRKKNPMIIMQQWIKEERKNQREKYTLANKSK